MDASAGKMSFSSRPSARRAERSARTSAAEFQKTTRNSVSTAMTASGRPANTASKFIVAGSARPASAVGGLFEMDLGFVRS